jgi:acetyl esterase/lipase
LDLTDAYENGAYIEGAAEYPSRWAAQAGAFCEAMGDRFQTISYADGPRAGIDLFLPEVAPVGTVVFVHGGYWKAFDRSFWSHLAAGPLAHGWAVAMPSYTLCPDARISQITQEVAQAVETVAELGDGPMSLAGHSAGGHLVARMLDRSVLPSNLGARLHAVVPISPVADLRPLLETDMNSILQLDAVEAAAESPVLKRDRYPVRVTVWVGENERPAFLDQAQWLGQAWGVQGVISAGRHHFDVIDDLADPSSEMVHALIA